MYLDQDILDFPPEFRELILKRGDCDIIIGTDSNAHSTVWNCANTDNRGEFIEDFLIKNDLTCLNVGNNPTFKSARGFTSIIDITIANYRLATSISNWKVENHLHISDHFIITFTINNCPNFRNVDLLDWNYKKGDWVLFKKELELGLKKYSNARIWSATTIKKKLEHFLSELNNALEIACPKKRSKRKFKYPLWWDENLTIMRSKLRKLAKNKTLEGKNSYISLRREYKKHQNCKIGWVEKVHFQHKIPK